jgi:hypothetical protein
VDGFLRANFQLDESQAFSHGDDNAHF